MSENSFKVGDRVRARATVLGELNPALEQMQWVTSEMTFEVVHVAHDVVVACRVLSSGKLGREAEFYWDEVELLRVPLPLTQYPDV